MNNQLSIQVTGQGDQWEQIADQVEKFGESNEWSMETSFGIRLILEELVVNAVSYGSEDQTTEVRLDVLSETKLVRLELYDNGNPYNPLEEAPTPDFDSSIEDRPVGGLGVHLVKQLSDEISYRHENGYNILTIIKRRTG